jgi:hypothetical protein
VTAPVGDAETDRTVVVETRRTVAGLTAAVRQGLARAAGSDRTFVLLSMVDTRLTPPLQLALRTPGCRWVVHEGRGRRAYDGLRGMPVRWDGAAWVDDGDRPRLEPPKPGGSGWLELDTDTVSRASEDLLLGRGVEAVAAGAGLELAGWGSGEPAARPWSREDLTRSARDRLPRPSPSTVVGRGDGARSLAGLLEVHRVRGGVREHLRAVVGMAAEPAPDAVRAYAVRLAEAGARSALLSWQSGRADGCRTALPHPPALPLGAVVGPASGVLDAVRAEQRGTAEDLPGGAVWVPFGVFPYRDLARLTALLHPAG